MPLLLLLTHTLHTWTYVLLVYCLRFTRPSIAVACTAIRLRKLLFVFSVLENFHMKNITHWVDITATGILSNPAILMEAANRKRYGLIQR